MGPSPLKRAGARGDSRNSLSDRLDTLRSGSNGLPSPLQGAFSISPALKGRGQRADRSFHLLDFPAPFRGLPVRTRLRPNCPQKKSEQNESAPFEPMKGGHNMPRHSFSAIYLHIT